MLQRLPEKYRSAQLENRPMEGDMNNALSQLNTNELFGKLFGFGISLYAIALLAQVLQSYSLV